jgi:lipid A ethanolaminephosphotransferase
MPGAYSALMTSPDNHAPSARRLFSRGRRYLPAFTIPATSEQLLWAASLFWALAANRLFLGAALKSRDLSQAASWGFGLALVVMLTALHYLLMAPLAHRRSIKPLLALLVMVTAASTYFMQAFGVYLDPSMIRNVLRTDVAEARELLSWALLGHLLVYAVLPLAVLWRVRLQPRPSLGATLRRALGLGVAAALFVGSLLAVYQPFSSLMRNHKELRYLVTPGNVLWSVGAVAAAEFKGAAQPRQALGLDATPGPRMAARAAPGARPLVVVVVVGETARAANWGLSGYRRQTTPQLAQLPVLNFTDVTACGTNTESSLPCMFAPVGRRDYDEARIRGSDSLMHVLSRAGVAVHWRDNQSGCKGVCDGLPSDEVVSINPGGLCKDGHCMDEGLLSGLDERLAALPAKGSASGSTQVWVLHMLGNHGPSYFRRYPPAFARFLPACEKDDLHLCTQDEIVNAYDNALLYTDHVLASLIGKLRAAQGVDSAMLFVSDHGESLGENNLFLHGLPYAIAPDVQKKVPMVMWFSDGLIGGARPLLDVGCLRQRAALPHAHDHLFHTVLGLVDLKTTLREPAWDLSAPCRSDGTAATH